LEIFNYWGVYTPRNTPASATPDDTLTDVEIGGVPIDKVVIYACGEKD